jgi:DNA-binding winged helix-turn-helix (wHTH) protein/tetratricopeptide (TPR) repeat protein
VSARLLRFGVFELDLAERKLRRRGYQVPLPPQPFAVLAELALRRGGVVSREELRALLWGASVHGDHERGLNHCLNRIRRVLGDDARTPRFVETVRRVGYRFLADVEVVETRADAVEVRAEVPLQARPPSRPRRWAAAWLAAALALAVQSAPPGRRAVPPTSSSPEAHGYALLAYKYMHLGEGGQLPADEAFPAARRAAQAALSIEDNPHPLLVLAALDLNYDWDWAGAEETYRRALRLDPELVGAGLGYARLLSSAGRHPEALRIAEDLETRNPDCPVVAREVAMASYRARRFDEAARRFRRWATLQPELRDPHHWLAILHYLRGDDESAVAEVRRVMALAKAGAPFVARFESLPPSQAMQFYLRGCIQYLERLTTERVTPDDFARLRALLGDREEALRDLERAADERSPRLLPQIVDPVFDSLRTEARFVALKRRVAPLT